MPHFLDIYEKEKTLLLVLQIRYFDIFVQFIEFHLIYAETLAFDRFFEIHLTAVYSVYI